MRIRGYNPHDMLVPNSLTKEFRRRVAGSFPVIRCVDAHKIPSLPKNTDGIGLARVPNFEFYFSANVDR